MSSRPVRLAWLAAPLAFCLAASPALTTAQRPINQGDLAAYRLTEPVYRRFAHGARLIAAASRKEPHLGEAPLFTREIAMSGDAVEMAAVLQARLDREHALRSALFAADIDAREFTLFALTLFAARVAHGFAQAGVIHVMPDGAAGGNVAFVAARHADITALLAEMGIR